MKKIVILGTGGVCMDILETINLINSSYEKYEVLGFLDDDPERDGRDYYGVKVLGPLSHAGKLRDAFFVNGIGTALNFWVKKDIVRKTLMPAERFESIIHPSASVSSMAQIGNGVVVLQNATITSNVKLGNHVMVFPNAVVSHDCVIGDFTSITGGVCVSGGVTIGESCYLGTNSSIRENIKIGNNCLIGMGSNLLKDVEDNSVMLGNPATFKRNTVPDK
ncbi:acetyltransferase [Bacteroidota bacterium]